MDAICTKLPSAVSQQPSHDLRPSRAEAEEAVRTLLAWAGEDPEREGLLDTPQRVVKAYGEFFSGYGKDPKSILSKTFEEVGGYDDLVLLTNIRVESHCEHHMVPFIGVAHVAYLPTNRVVGLSKLARVVEMYAKRLQTQENMTAQIADAIQGSLDPKGVAVFVSAEHQCMSMRGVHQPGVQTITTKFSGVFEDDSDWRNRFLQLIKAPTTI